MLSEAERRRIYEEELERRKVRSSTDQLSGCVMGCGQWFLALLVIGIALILAFFAMIHHA